jgi:aminopeptidase-like protein
MIGEKIHALASQLWPLNRSITGEGVRTTLSVLKKELPDLGMHEVPTGTQVFDWTVPKEWKVKEAFIQTPTGKRICEFNRNNLHLVGYSIPVRKKLTLTKLKEHLYSLPNQPDAIPYITSYYKERWGFCLSHNELTKLPDGEYEVFIDSELFDGSLTYGELLIPGLSESEVFISTYVCHPSMANNELSGPCVTTFIAKEILKQRRKLTYRIVFIPETIGSITYLSRHSQQLKSKVVAGFNVSCIGDDRAYSYLPTRNGNTLSDTVAKHVLKNLCPSFVSYSWSDRGSDERQYCAPGIDLPIASIMRTKYGKYDEYHTSLDDLTNVVTPAGLEGGFNALWRAIEAIERNCFPKVTVLCEPQLGKRGLYPTLSTKETGAEVRLMMDLITWSDGTRTLIEIAELCNSPIWELYPIIEKLSSHQLIVLLDADLTPKF